LIERDRCQVALHQACWWGSVRIAGRGVYLESYLIAASNRACDYLCNLVGADALIVEELNSEHDV